MPQKQRKFTNGHYLSFESDCDGYGNISKYKSDFSVKLKKNEEEKVVDRVDTLRTKWTKVNQLQNKSEKTKFELLKSILSGIKLLHTKTYI
jgi:hypothetical protein